MGLLDKFTTGSSKPDDTARRARLDELTAVAKRGLSAFAETGRALKSIQAEELWRLTSPTWDKWCNEALGLTDRRVAQLIEAASTCEALQSTGVLPRSERVARELSGLPSDEKKAAWLEAVEAADGKEPTAEQVAKAASKRRKKSRRPAVARPASFPVPGAAVRVTPRRRGFTSYVAALRHALELAEKAAANEGKAKPKAA
jgi:hypothetical protein